MMMTYLTGWEMPRWFNKAQSRLQFRDSHIVRVLICGRVCLLGSRILELGGRAAGDGPWGQCPAGGVTSDPSRGGFTLLFPSRLSVLLPGYHDITPHAPATMPCLIKGPTQTARTMEWGRFTQQTGKTPGFSHSIYFTSKLCVSLAYP